MKWYYLVKRYGLVAIVVVFLLIWLSQQNSINESHPYSALEHQSAVRQERDLAELLDDRDRLRRLDVDERSQNYSEVRSSSINTTRGNTSASSQILRDRPTGFLIKDGGKAEGRSENSRSYQVAAVGRQTYRYSVAVSDENARLSKMIDLQSADVNSPSGRNASHGKQRRVQSATNSSETRAVIVTVLPYSDRITVASRRRKWRRFQQPTSNDTAANLRPADLPNESVDSDLMFRAVKPSAAPPRQQVPSSNDDAGDSLVLAQQLAIKNFVKADGGHLPSDDRPPSLRVGAAFSVTSNGDDRSPGRSSKNATAKSFSFHSAAGVGDENEADELKRFAGVAARPDYDLPLLRKTMSDRRIALSSTVRPDYSVSAAMPSVRPIPVSDEDGGSKLEDDDALADTDSVMSGVEVMGDVDPEKMYAVFSTTTENRDALNFIFLLPLTVLAWKRVGFDSVVVIVGPVDVWNSDELFHFVLTAVRQLGAVVVFFEPRPEKSVMISQVD